MRGRNSVLIFMHGSTCAFLGARRRIDVRVFWSQNKSTKNSVGKRKKKKKNHKTPLTPPRTLHHRKEIPHFVFFILPLVRRHPTPHSPPRARVCVCGCVSRYRSFVVFTEPTTCVCSCITINSLLGLGSLILIDVPAGPGKRCFFGEILFSEEKKSITGLSLGSHHPVVSTSARSVDSNYFV